MDFVEDITRNVLLMNGSADDSFFLTFYPEPGFRFPDDYEVVRVVSNEKVLNNVTDIELMTTALANEAINMTATLDFHEFPGTTNVTIEFRNKSDGSLFDSVEVQYLAAGIGIYRNDPEFGQVLLSGTDKSLRIPDYKDNLNGNNHYEFGTMVQFLNGSTSDAILSRESAVDSASLFSIDTLTPVLMKTSGQIDWDSEVCHLSSGTWDGSDLTLPDGCGMGLALGEGNATSGGGLHFGFDFEENRAGNLDVLFEWDRFTEGSEFEDIQYENYLKTVIGGEPPAIVRLVSPVGEFSTNGGQDLYVEMINADNTKVKSFIAKGADSPFLPRPGTYQEFKGPTGYYESAVFETTPGSGKLLPWTIDATRQNGTLDKVTGLPASFPLTFIDQSGFQFSYDNKESILTRIEPSQVLDKGGDEVMLFGSFEDFDKNKENHKIIFSNAPINSSLIKTANSTHISLVTPARSEVGSAWQYKVALQTEIDESNSVDILYGARDWPLGMRVFGGSLDRDGSGNFEYGRCSVITIVGGETKGNAKENLQYKWAVLGPDGKDILTLPQGKAIETSSNTLTMPSAMLPDSNTVYTVRVRASDVFGSGTSFVTVKRTPNTRLGVIVIPPSNRTLSVPESSMRLVAKIDLPHSENCNGSAVGKDLISAENLVYEWGWEDKGKIEGSPGWNDAAVFKKHQIKPAGSNLTDTGDTGIIRIGREFIIPRSAEHLSLGRHLAYLYVFEAAERTSEDEPYKPLVNPLDNSTVYGYSETEAWVLRSELQAVIGNDEARVTTNGETTIQISGEESYDPDILENARTTGLSYLWSCEQGWASDFSEAVPCVEALMPKSSVNFVKFEVPSTALMTEVAKDPRQRDSELYLRYKLLITKVDSADSKRTASTSQVVEVTQKSELQLLSQQAQAQLAVRQAAPVLSGTKATIRQSSSDLPWKIQQGIKITNGEGKTTDPKMVKFWEELIITPVIEPQMKLGTTWSFALTYPLNQRNSFFVTGNLLTELGFYEGGFDATSSTFPLGIKAGMLSPNQDYIFKIVFSYDADGIQREGTAEVAIRTMEYPLIVFAPLSISQGTPETVFRAAARVDVDQDSAYNYQFYLYDLDDPSVDEYCLDGCTGAPVVLFRTFRPGNYSIEARLLAANGKTVLDAERNERNISVIANGKTPSTEEYEGDMKKDFLIGDDGGVNQRGFFISHAMHDQIDVGSTKDSGLVALSSDGEKAIESCHALVPDFVKSTLRIAEKEQPTTANVRNYIVMASNYAKLSCVENESTLYDLLGIVHSSLGRIPSDHTVQTHTFEGKLARSTLDNITTDVVQEAQRFYNFSITRAISSQIARGSSRNRLSPVEGEVNNLILDLYESWQVHVLRVATSGQVCGFSRTVSTAVSDGLADPELLSYDHGARSNPFGHSQLLVAIRCNEEQGLSLEGIFSKFEYCSSVFTPDEDGSTRKMVSLAEMYDYVYLSGIQGQNMTDSSRLVHVDITVLEKSKNRLVSALSSDVFSLEGEGSKGGMCYTIGMQMEQSVVSKMQLEKKLLSELSTSTRIGTGESGSGTSESCTYSAFTMWPMKKYDEKFTQPFQSNAYMRREDGIIEQSVGSNESYVTIKSAHLGLFGAIRTPCTQSFGIGAFNDITGQLKSVLWLIFGIIITVIVVTALTYMLASTLFTGDDGVTGPAAAAQAYVERDYFGRGGVHLVNQNNDAMSGTGTDTTIGDGDMGMKLEEIEGLGGAGNR